MKKYFKKFKGIICLVMCLCMALATFQVSVFAEETNADKVTISGVNLVTDKDGKVFGKGILTGTSVLDDKCWDHANSNKGFDDANNNDIIRSFDTIKYTVNTTLNNLNNEAHVLGYQIEIPNDDDLDVISDGRKEMSVDETENKKIYTFEWDVSKNYQAGGIEHWFSINVGNKHQGDEIKPKVFVYVDSKDNKQDVTNIQTVYVTTAPMYNIVLEQATSLSTGKNKYDFKKSGNVDQTQKGQIVDNRILQNAKDYTNDTVVGFRQAYGVGLEVKKPGNGIQGVELPDPDKDFTFDIDLSNYTVNGLSVVADGFKPLLFYYGKNISGGACVDQIPYSDSGNKTGNDSWCDNSGDIDMVQDGNVIHVTVKKFSIDYTKFPKTNAKGNKSYGSSIESMKDGFFSAFQFQLVFPYKNKDGYTLMDKYNINAQGTANATITVDNMNATSKNGSNTKLETIPLYYDNDSSKYNDDNDNSKSYSFAMQKNGERNHTILYSSREEKKWANEYSESTKPLDDDIAAVGAKDLAFTVTYTQSNVGDSDETSQIPLAIEQMVLFDGSAIKLEEKGENDKGRVDLSNRTGYSGSYFYLHRKTGGHLNAEDMRNATLDEFVINNDPTDCDGVLVRYRGCYNESLKDTVTQTTRFFCNVDNNYDLKNNVYMITAVTNTWDANDLTKEEKDSILAEYNHKDLDEVTRDEYNEWINNHTEIDFFKRTHHALTIDHRDYYTVPEYDQAKYSPSKDHRFSIDSADALYLVPYKVSIQKLVAQKNDQGNSREQYNVSNKERYVDYQVLSQINFENNVTPPEDAKTTVTYTDTLPAGLTYIKGSAYLGGKYESQFPNKGKVTGGKKIEPDVSEDGRTLTWTIPNVSLSSTNLEKIHYSCKIGDEEDPTNDVSENSELMNDIKIHTEEDKRSYSLDNDNEAATSITIAKNRGFYLRKTGKELLELEDKGYFDLIVTNTSSSEKNDLFVVDTMPANDVQPASDVKKTVMNGQYKLTKVSINTKLLKGADDFELWYTNENKYKGLNAENISPNDITKANGWRQATTSKNGDVVEFSGEGLIDSWPTSIVYKDHVLEKDTIAKIRLEYDAIGAEKDHLTNAVTIPNGESYLHDEAEVDIVSRSLEGTVWIDENKDGKLDDIETKLPDVNVTLYVKDKDGNYQPYKAYQQTKDGKTYTCGSTLKTDANGHYKFDGLPEGDYKVEFTSSDGTSLGEYEATIANQGTDKQSSKVTPENTDPKSETDKRLNSGSIPDLTMPSKEYIVDHSDNNYYNLPNQNLGLIIPKVTISGKKQWVDDNNRDGVRPEKIEINLYANGKLKETKEVTKKDDWQYTFKDLDKYNDNGLITYTITENSVEGYTSNVNGYNVTNTHEVAKTSVSVTKKWNDNDDNDRIRPEKVIVHLYANGKDTGEKVELSADNQWSASFENLDQYKDGKKIVYTVEEDEVKGYKVGITGSQDTGYILTNTHGNETVKVKGTKTWDDQNDQDKVRPTKITIRLLADGKEIAVKEVTKVTDWTYDFGNLAKYKDGKEIVYTISEDEVEGYKTSIKGFNITNSHIPTTPSKPSTDTPSKDDQNPKGDQPSKETPKGDQSSKNEQPTNGSQIPVVKGKTKTTNKQQTNKIKTGDDTHLMIYVLFVVVSFMGILFLKKKAHN